MRSLEKRRVNPFIILLLAHVLICVVLFYNLLGNMNSSMLTISGDGIKNYFTYLYYIRYDHAAHFSGMNYPFGENVVFTDNMPALSLPQAWLGQWFPGLRNYGLLVMHCTFMLSYALCSIYVLKILRLFGVRGWWSIASALFITFFTPQFTRMFGHFGLSLACFFPMFLYWLMQYDRLGKRKHLLYLYGITAIFMFMHPYYLAFSLVITMVFCFATAMLSGSTVRKKAGKIIPAMIPAILAVISFKLYLYGTDPVDDRLANPLGYLDARSSAADILTSGFNFIGHYAFYYILGGKVSNGSEGYAYPGLVTILCTFYLIYRVLKSIIVRLGRKKNVPVHPVRAYRKWVIMAFIVLLFAMGAPFIWGLEFLVERFTVLRQFRAIGRFSWIVYYLMMIYSSIFLYRFFVKMRWTGMRKSYMALATAVLAVWLIEWNGYGQEVRRRIEPAADNYERFFSQKENSWPAWLHSQGYTAAHFQGLVGLPYVHIGSDKTSMQKDLETTMYMGSQMAYQTGLPLLDAMLARSSVSQAYENLSLLDGPFTPKPFVNRLNAKPFLLFVSHNVPLLQEEEHMISYARYLGKKDGLDLYELDLHKMALGDSAITDSVKNLAMAAPQREGLLGANGFAYAQHFNQAQAPFSLTGDGHAFAATYADTQFVLRVPVTHPSNDTMFFISSWFNCYNHRTNDAAVNYRQYDASGKLLYESNYYASDSRSRQGDWYLVEQPMYIAPGTVSMDFFITGGLKRYKALDELMIRPQRGIVYAKMNSKLLLLNNRPVNIHP